jgi:hypothetical protein
VLKNKTVKTWDGNIYSWDPFVAASMPGQADVPRNTSTGSESTTYGGGSEFANASVGTPFGDPNRGISAKASQILATAGIPGGTGNQSQSAPNTGTSAGGIFNPSTTQRSAPRPSETKRRNEKMEQAKSALKARTAEFKAKQQAKLDRNKNAGPPQELVSPNPEPAAPHLGASDMEHATHRG